MNEREQFNDELWS